MVTLYFKIVYTFIFLLGIELWIWKYFKNEKVTFFSIILGLVIFLFVTLRVKNQIELFSEFNRLSSSEVSSIYIDSVQYSIANQDLLFERLRYYEFSFLEHPREITKKHLIVITKDKEFKFIIYKTNNQGILVSRLYSSGREFMTYSNNSLYYLFDE